MLDIPTSERFRQIVEKAQNKKFDKANLAYVESVRKFKHLDLVEISKQHENDIIRPYLFRWGRMQRWLGNNGLEKISEKIKQNSFASNIEPFREKSLKSMRLEQSKDLIAALFSEISEVSFKSKKGDSKQVQSTASSKVLHLCCPDLFIPWDASIRRGYLGPEKKRGVGNDYFEFLTDAQKLWIALDGTIKELQRNYDKTATRIIDEYNWVTYNPKKVQ